MLFHSHKVQEQAKSINCDRNKNIVFLGRMTRGATRNFWGDGKALYPAWGGVYMKVPTFVKSHQNVHLKSVLFT